MALARALSKLGLASRSEAIALILAGRVRIAGRVAANPGQRVVPEGLAVTIDDTAMTPPARRTIAFHKPRGVITTRRDPHGRPTVYDLIAGAGHGLAPAGRLDLASSGLLLCTNDTAFAAWLTRPESGVEKEYVLTVRGRVSAADVARLTRGLRDDGEWLQPLSLRVLKVSGRESHLAVVLTEGRNREIRRLFAAVDHEVTRLRRVRIGGLTLDTLAAGAWRDIPEERLAATFPEYSEGRSRRPRGRRPAPLTARPLRGDFT